MKETTKTNQQLGRFYPSFGTTVQALLNRFAAAKAEANSERIFMSSFYFESLKLFLERFKRLAF